MPTQESVMSQLLPAAGQDGNQKPVRLDRYGGPYVTPVGLGGAALAGEGSYYRACNPTMGTGIAMGIRTAFSDTANVLGLMRNVAAVGGRSVYLDYVRLICTAAGQTTSASDLAVVVDTANRFGSGGSQLTPVNANTGVSVASIAEAYFGDVTAAAATGGKRVLSRTKLKTQAAPCWTVGDQVILNFGSGSGSIGANSGTATVQLCIDCGPVVLAPGNNHSMLLHMWNTANATTPPSWEVEFGWWER